MFYQRLISYCDRALIYVGILFAIGLMFVPQALSAQDEPMPDLQLSSSSELHIDAANDGNASAGDTLLYHVTITNEGDAKATFVRFLGKLDTNLSLIEDSIVASQGSVRTGSFVQIEVGELAPGESATVDFQATIDAGGADGQVLTTTQISFAEDTRSPDETGGLSQGRTLVVTPVEAGQAPQFMIYLPLIDSGISR